MSAPQAPRGPGRGLGRSRSRSGPPSRRGAPLSRTAFQSAPTKPLPRNPTTSRSGVPNRAGGAVNGGRYRGQVQRPSPLSRVTTNNSVDESWRDPTVKRNTEYKERISELWTTLKKNRERERKEAIRDGFLADPDKPTSLANAITPVGTCQDMCPEFERVERIHQNMVDGPEKTTAQFSDLKVPWENFFVKRFRRSAAGYDEQLPSDIRPPTILQRTLNYLLDDVIGGGQPLADVHKFVWDRTRGIRNDFSIQQVTKTEDLRIAIDCFERIARFHILSLHQLSHPSRSNDDFDAFQEREQLNNTLLSLMYYYDDSRAKVTSPNEAEFRAYCIIFEIQNQRPDLEDRAQNWPKPLLKDARIQTALKLYAAAGNVSDDQGPLRPHTTFSIAQSNYGRFWSIVDSNAVSYLMACTAEIYFNYIRTITLNVIWKTYRRGGAVKLEDWILSDLVKALGFDTEDQVMTFCEEHGFSIGERQDGSYYLDLTSVHERSLTDTNPRRQQIFSKNLVDQKRLSRTLPAVINGLSAAQARANGQVEDLSTREGSPTDDIDHDSMFVPQSIPTVLETTKPLPNNKPVSQATTSLPLFNPFSTPLSNTPDSNPFEAPSTTPASAPPISIFGKSFFESTPATGIGIISTSNPGLFPTATSSQPAAKGPSSTASFSWPPVPPAIPPTNANVQPATSTASSSMPWPGMFQSSVIAMSTPEHPQVSATGNIQPQINNQSSGSATLFPSFPSSSKPTPPPSFGETNNNPQLSSLNTQSTNNIVPQNPPDSKPSLFPVPNFLGVSSSSQATTKPEAIPIFNFSATPSEERTRWHPPSVISVPGPPSSLFQPPSQVQSPKPSHDLTTSSTSTISNSDKLSPKPSGTISQVKIGPPKPDPRPHTMDQLANAFVCENDGLLQQFLEYKIGPMIVKSISKVKKEREHARVAQARHYLLGKKYLQRWKDNAWKRGLMRKGRERRKNFAQSMQALSRNTLEKFNMNDKLPNISSVGQSDRMPPPPTPERRLSSASKKESLANGSEDVRSEQKSHQNLECNFKEPSKTSYHRPIKHHHRRSHTLGSASHVSKSSGGASSQSTLNPRPSNFGPESLFSESILKKARRLVPGPTDTTRTDYFLLKARGIDPDTPIIPATRKRRLSDQDEMVSKRASVVSSSADSWLGGRSVPHSQSVPNFTPKRPAPSLNVSSAKVNNEDDELFTQMRRVKEAMSESISWFREEREKSELSRSSSVSMERPTETEKERRLREFKFTPSRTELRLRETGGHGLLPKNWGQRTIDGETIDGRYISPITGNSFARPMGFRAFTTKYSSPESGPSQPAEEAFGTGTGASPNDAIEL